MRKINEELLILLLILSVAHTTEASPLLGYTAFLFPRRPAIGESANVVEAAGNGKICSQIESVQGGMWWAFFFVAIILIALTGLFAGLTLAVMSVDLAKLKVWTEIGQAKQKCVSSIIN